MSIRAKFLAVLTLILTIGVATTGAALIAQHRRHDETLLAEKQLLLVENAAFALQGNLSFAAREVSRLSRLKEIDPGDEEDPERQLLYGAHANSVLFQEVRILDADGRVTTAQPASAALPGQSYADRHWFDQAKRAHLPLFYTAPEHAQRPEGIAVVVPVRQQGRFIGAIQGVLDLHDDKVLLPELRHAAGPQGEFALVDHDGRGIFPPFPPGDAGVAGSGFAFAFKELGQQRAGARRKSDEHGDFMYAWAPVGIGGWGVAMRWPFSSLSANLRGQIEVTAAILIGGTMLVWLVALAFAAYLTRPLLALGDVAARLARGEPGGAARSSRRDEVGALFNAFHSMETDLALRDQKIREDLDTISRLNASLEERVAERTRELQAAQERLIEVERFAAMGKTAAAIAHELKNALNGLGMCVDLVLSDGRVERGAGANANSNAISNDRVRAQIRYEIGRLRDVTESLLTFSRMPRIDRTPTDVNALVRRALDVLSEQVSDGAVTVETEFEGGPAEPLVIPCDGYKMQGVIINLIKNAVEAMSTRRLDLDAPTTDDPEQRERTLSLRTRRLPEERMVIVEVSDTGPGFLDEARQHLFEPFFTTKVTGTGLGLATSRRIVEAHGGTIDLRLPEPGREGSRVVVRLPDHIEQVQG